MGGYFAVSTLINSSVPIDYVESELSEYLSAYSETYKQLCSGEKITTCSLDLSQAAHFYDNEILGYQAQSYRGKSSKKEWWYVAASKNCPDTGRRGPSTISLKNLC